MADTKKVKIEIVNSLPAFIDLFEALLPTEDILQVFKTASRNGVFFGKEYGLEVEYTWGTHCVNFGGDEGTRNLAYHNLARLLLKDATV